MNKVLHKPVKDTLIIELVTTDDPFDITEIQYARILGKGPDTSKDYKEGDIIGFIKGCEYKGVDITLLEDKDVRVIKYEDGNNT